jgi:outer membrane protein assembly factor BamA
MDPFTAQHKLARQGDFIKDMSPQRRSLGLVMQVKEETNMMQVKFPKIGKLNWIPWHNYGHYRVV